MTLDIRELTPALLDGCLCFFDHDAFADVPWSSSDRFAVVRRDLGTAP